MPAQYVVRRQRVATVKVERSKALRREMTPAEHRLWSALRRKQLDGIRFRRQQVIDGFIVDFYCHSTGLVVEVDGDVHEQQQEYDAARDEILTARGVRILRFANDAVMDELDTVIATIHAAITEHVEAHQ